MTRLLEGRTAVVTGAASGNGRAIAQQLAEHGADVVVADVRENPREGGTPTHKWITAETGQRAAFVSCDVTEYEDLVASMKAAKEFGDVDVVVNNAGVLRRGKVTELSEADWDFVMDVNLKGVFFGTKAAAAHMDAGSIINIASAAADVGGAANALYCASKGGVKLFTYSTAAELGPDIRVNAVHPGTTDTQMVIEDIEIIGTEKEQQQQQQLPLERLGKPRDVADAVVFLASDLASYVTGTSLLVDGGAVNTA